MKEKNIEELKAELEKKETEIKTLELCNEHYRKRISEFENKIAAIEAILKIKGI